MMKITTPELGRIRVQELLKQYELEGLLNWLDKTDYFKAPASTRYHGAEQCGLVNHSIAVFEAFVQKTMTLVLPQGDDGPPETWLQDATVACLLHDVCKLGLYKEAVKWRKAPNGKWESYPGYEVNEELVQIGHGTESLRLIEQHYKFEHEAWAQAVAWHMGTPEGWVDKQQYYHAVEEYPEVLALHTADVYASFIMGY